jgi:transposase
MAKVRRQAAEWAALIDQWRQSGLSLPAFCQRHGLSRGSMQNWVYKPELKQAVEAARREAQGPADVPPAPAAVPAFLPVRVVQAAAAVEESDRSGVEVVIGGGRRVVLGPGFDAETLRRVVAVLEGRVC